MPAQKNSDQQKRRLIAIDPSLTCSGWALFSLKSAKLLGAGKIKPLSTQYHLSQRLDHLHDQITQVYDKLRIDSSDILMCEAPTTVVDPAALFKVEQVRTSFESIARERGVLVPGRINPRSVHYEVFGCTGKQLPRKEIKIMAVHAVDNLYRQNLEQLGFECSAKNYQRNQDIIDAILVGHLAVNRYQTARAQKVPFFQYLASLEQRKSGRGLRKS